MKIKNKVNKKAVIGDFVGMFTATIVIIFILVLFALVSSVVKLTTSGGVSVSDVGYNPRETGFGEYRGENYFNFVEYDNNFGRLVHARYLIAGGQSVKQTGLIK